MNKKIIKLITTVGLCFSITSANINEVSAQTDPWGNYPRYEGVPETNYSQSPVTWQCGVQVAGGTIIGGLTGGFSGAWAGGAGAILGCL